jgi:hypothetical protein
VPGRAWKFAPGFASSSSPANHVWPATSVDGSTGVEKTRLRAVVLGPLWEAGDVTSRAPAGTTGEGGVGAVGAVGVVGLVGGAVGCVEAGLAAAAAALAGAPLPWQPVRTRMPKALSAIREVFTDDSLSRSAPGRFR